MNKKFIINYLFTAITLSLLIVFTTACGSDSDSKNEPKNQPNTLVGTWLYTINHSNYSLTEILTFNSDGTFILVWNEDGGKGEKRGTWYYDQDNKKLTTNTIVGEKPGYYTYTVVLKDNQLTLIEADGDINGPYIRQ